MSSVFGTRKVLQEIRELRLESREILAEIREMRLQFNEEFRAARLEHQERIEEHRQFTRECIARMERAEAREAKRIDDIIDENRAQRQALLRMLDRLGPAPGTA